jgi:hypothetical protein
MMRTALFLSAFILALSLNPSVDFQAICDELVVNIRGWSLIGAGLVIFMVADVTDFINKK